MPGSTPRSPKPSSVTLAVWPTFMRITSAAGICAAISTWLVSSNAWDVVGAKAAGLRAVWVRRQATAVFDPWEVEPDVVVSSLAELADWLAGRPNQASHLS